MPESIFLHFARVFRELYFLVEEAGNARVFFIAVFLRGAFHEEI